MRPLRVTPAAMVPFGFSLALVIMALIAMSSYHGIKAFQADLTSVTHSQRIIAEIEQLLSELKDAEAGQRGFLLTGSEDYLESFTAATTAIPFELRSLRALTADNASQQQRLGLLEPLIEERLGQLKRGIDGRRTHVAKPGGDAAELEAGKRVMDRIRDLVSEMQVEERGLLVHRARESDDSAQSAMFIIVAGNSAGFVILLASYWLLRREVAQREAAEARARARADEIEDLYNGAPCGYHSLDSDGRFVRVNDTELQWLGYTRGEILGRHFTQIATPGSARSYCENLPGFRQRGWVRNVEYELVRKDGTALPVALSATTVHDAAGNYVMSRSTIFDITERRLAEKEIRTLNTGLAERAVQLEAANRELESFSYSVSHDLRAPLRAVDGYSQMLEEDYAHRLDTEGRRLLGAVRENSRRMGRLIDDLLAFSRLGRKPISTTRVDVNALVADVLREIAAAPAAVLPRFVVENLPAARGDRALLRQVWINLLSNAVKFSCVAREPRVEVRACAEEAEIVYSVTDNGAGFDMKYYGKLFGMFQRLHSADDFPGTGVGLAIVQRIVTRHGGRVWARGAPGHGATFYFTLPQGEYGE